MLSRNHLFTFLFFLSPLLFGGHADAQTTRMVALGDSNTAGFGVAGHEAFPARLELMLRTIGADVQVTNAGISGDTTAGMLNRLDDVASAGTQIALYKEATTICGGAAAQLRLRQTSKPS
jgi:acyl-CoA thioesterase-1